LFNVLYSQSAGDDKPWTKDEGVVVKMCFFSSVVADAQTAAKQKMLTPLK